MTWIAEHWVMLSIIVYAVINILNGITKHYSNYSGLVKVLTIISEFLSFLTSWGSEKFFKLPGKSIPK